MSDDEFTGIQKKLLGWLLIAVLGGNTGVILLNKSNPQMRSDPFTGTDAKELEKSLKDYFEQKLFIHKLQIPPTATRKRIYSLEEWVHDKDPSYKRPTDQW